MEPGRYQINNNATSEHLHLTCYADSTSAFLCSFLVLVALPGLFLNLGEVLLAQPAFPRVLLTPLHTAVASPPVLTAVDPLGSEVPAALHLTWLLGSSSVLETKTP